MLNECSKKIKKKKFNLQKLRERMERKLKGSEDLQMNDFNSFGPLHFENGWTDQIGNGLFFNILEKNKNLPPSFKKFIRRAKIK